MNIKQALKEKNKLVAKINEEKMRLHSYNSIEVGAERVYEPLNSYESWLNSVDQLVELKSKIHKANAKVYDKIFMLSELKSIVSQLKSLDCSHGKQPASYRTDKEIVKDAVIGIVERDKIVKSLEERIENLQNELDIHNAKTKI